MGGGPVSAYLISYIFRKINGIAVIKFGTFITTVAKDVYPHANANVSETHV